MHIGLLLFEITCIWDWQSKSLTWNLQPLSCGINIYIYMSLLKDLKTGASIWLMHIELLLFGIACSWSWHSKLPTWDLQPLSCGIYIYLMFCWRSEKQELGTLSNRFISLLKSLEPLNSESPACLETYMSGNNQSSVGGEGVSHMDKHSC